MDPEVSALVSAVPAEHPRADELFTAVRAAWEAEQTDLDPFLDRLRQEADHLLGPDDLDLLRAQLDQLGGDPMDHLRRLAEHDPAELAAHHAELHADPHADPYADPHAAGPDLGGRLDWVRPDQADRMAAEWGPGWPEFLPDQLDHRWGADWESHPAEHKAEWLGAVLDELAAEQSAVEQSATDQSTAEQQTGAGRFDWVPAEQADRLQSAWGPDWQQHLGDQLDHRWGADWESHPAEHKATWLPDVVDDLLTPAEAIPAQADSPEQEQQPDQAQEAAAGFSAREIDDAVSAAIADVPGAEDLSEADLAEIRAAVAQALTAEPAPQ
ncbi:hypothetical protein ACFPM7_19635 [Actinokineospora guangxiensis]|uniref:Uncharacterized protein n=1 Tax=Actinokineospora guangxiensis TaxID=1490288 RepID=A0ABW0ESN3_9PSEU